MQRVLMETKQGKAAQSKLERSSKAKQKKLDKKRSKLEADQAKLKNLAGDQLMAAQEQLQKDFMEMQNIYMTMQQELAEQEGKILEDMYKKTRAEGFGEEVQRRIMTGTYVLSHGYYDAYYLQAQKIRRLIADDFQRAFKECDVIAGPVAPTVAWQLGAHGADPLADYLADIFTLPASLAGLPGMSVPAGFGEGGMPVGLQLIGNYFQEGRLLNLAHRLQQATDFHLRAPEGF